MNEANSQLCRFGRFAEANRSRFGEPRRTLRFLGFTLYNTTSRRGKYPVGCRTASKHLSAALTRVPVWCKQHRHQKVAWQARSLNAVLRGHYHYFGGTPNYPSIKAFYRHVQWAWPRFVSRRSQRARISWEAFHALLERVPLEKPWLPKAVQW